MPRTDSGLYVTAKVTELVGLRNDGDALPDGGRDGEATAPDGARVRLYSTWPRGETRWVESNAAQIFFTEHKNFSTVR